jgi:hypothetical protein
MFTAMIVDITSLTDFWDVALCSSFEGPRRFGGTYVSH